MTALDSLHTEYGPWVRVGMFHQILLYECRHILMTTSGPNELSVNIPKAVRSVYKLDRGSFYSGRYGTSNFEECCLKDLYIGTPAKADSLITVMDRSVHSHRRQVIQVAFRTTTADSRSIVSKAWTRAVTGDAMYSYIPSTQVREQFTPI